MWILPRMKAYEAYFVLLRHSSPPCAAGLPLAIRARLEAKRLLVVHCLFPGGGGSTGTTNYWSLGKKTGTRSKSSTTKALTAAAYEYVLHTASVSFTVQAAKQR